MGPGGAEKSPRCINHLTMTLDIDLVLDLDLKSHLTSQNVATKHNFSLFDRDLWPTTLSYNPRLANVKVEPQAKNQGQRSNGSNRRAPTDKRTDTHTHTHGRNQTHYRPCYAVDKNNSDIVGYKDRRSYSLTGLTVCNSNLDFIPDSAVVSADCFRRLLRTHYCSLNTSRIQRIRGTYQGRI